MSAKRHRWRTTQSSWRDPDLCICMDCGMKRWREYMEPTVYEATDLRSWRSAPPCPPPADWKDPPWVGMRGGKRAWEKYERRRTEEKGEPR